MYCLQYLWMAFSKAAQAQDFDTGANDHGGGPDDHNDLSPVLITGKVKSMKCSANQIYY